MADDGQEEATNRIIDSLPPPAPGNAPERLFADLADEIRYRLSTRAYRADIDVVAAAIDTILTRHRADLARSPAGGGWKQRQKAGLRIAVTWLHARAKNMNDPHAKQVLDSAAFHLGESADELMKIKNIDLYCAKAPSPPVPSGLAELIEKLEKAADSHEYLAVSLQAAHYLHHASSERSEAELLRAASRALRDKGGK